MTLIASLPLEQLLQQVQNTQSYRRAEFRPAVEALGDVAIVRMVEWLANQDLQVFAGHVLEGLARRGHKDAVLRALREAFPLFEGDRDYLTRLGKRVAALEHAAGLPPQVAIWVGKINSTRRERGEPYLSEDETKELADNWQIASKTPGLYQNHCWNCQAPVLEGQHQRCVCGWLRCYCGACMSPRHGYCQIGAGRFPDADWTFSEATG
jgi:hypothetical protein